MNSQTINTSNGSLVDFPPETGENAAGTGLPMEPFVAGVFAAWNAAGVTWAVMRNAGGLPGWTRYDIDILIDPDDLSPALETLSGLASQQGWKLIGAISKRGYTCRMYRSAGEHPQYLPFDFFTCLEFRGISYGSAMDVLAARTRHAEGVWELSPGTQTAISILKELLPHSKLKLNARESIKKAATDHPAECTAALQAAGCAGPLANEMVSGCAAGSWAQVEALTPHVRRSLDKNRFKTLMRRSHAALLALIHLFRANPGIYVVLIGPDGCGKTTIAREVMQHTFKRPFKACRYLHGNFGVLPRFRDIRARVAGRDPSSARQQEQARAGEELVGMVPALPVWKSFLLVAYYAFDYTLGRLWIRRWRAQWGLIVADRSYYDYYFQLGHTRLPRWVLKCFQLTVPTPDLILYLKRDAGEMYRSKPELTIEEIRREQHVIEDLLSGNRKAVTIDGTQGVEAAVAQAVTEVMRVLDRKHPG